MSERFRDHERTKAAFAAVYDAYVERIYRFLYLKTDSRETCEDLTAETFMRAWRFFSREGADRIGNTNAFLYKIARNLLADYYRKKGKIKFVSAESLPLQDSRSLAEEAEMSSDVEFLKRHMGKLNEDYQSVLIWHYVEDIPVPEIAFMLERSEGATRVMISRALKALREQVKEA